MSKELDPTDFEAVISYYKIDSLDRQQEIWDRAMPKEMADHMFAAFAHNAGLGPQPGKYIGPQPDFEKALLELEEEDPYEPEQANQKDRSGDSQLFSKIKTLSFEIETRRLSKPP